MTKFQLIVLLLIPVFFLIIGLRTLTDYGINWDNPMHYNRGHAYLHFFLTGETNYLKLPKHPTLDESVDFKDIRGEYMQLFKDAKRSSSVNQNYKRSYYQSDIFNFEYFKDKDSGHPPLNGILAALTNYIFYQKLGILGDLYSHQLFGIIVTSTLILGVSILTFYLFGIFPALIAASTLALYPLFLGESHFNIKDPVLASFFGLTITCLYLGVVKKRTLFVILSSVFAGLSLGTKFNAFFLPFIILPWLIFYGWRVEKFKFGKKAVFIFLVWAFIPGVIFYLTWPYLWFNGLEGLLKIFKYYANEGIGSTADLSRFTLLGFNFFPVTWIILTTPIPVLILSLVGVIWLAIKFIKQKDQASLLILLWLFIPIIRVTFPNTTIYGGVRHIMEYIPALAIVAGAGSYFLLKSFPKIKSSIIIFLTFLMLLTLWEMIIIHPNQNVYFNQIIGGLSGAKAGNIPYWGNSFGNAYQQGIYWLNKNAEKNAKLGLPIGGTVNLSRENIREDIDLHNDNFSAFARKGEFQIEMSHDGLPKGTFTYAYLENFLIPVQEIKVNGVAILKIWKNDLKNTKPGFEKEVVYPIKKITQEKNQLKIELHSLTNLSRLYINHGDKQNLRDKSLEQSFAKNRNCSDAKNGNILTSKDGNDWKVQPDPISYPQMLLKTINAQNYDFVFLFAGEATKFITINLTDDDSCLFKNPSVEIMGLEKRPD